jgi:uncharacterized protein
MINRLWIILIVILGAFSQSSSGFGFSIITMSLFPLFFSVIDSMILIVFTNLVAVTFIVVRYYKHIQFKLLIIPVILSLITTYIGLINLIEIDNDIIIKGLGVLLILLAVYLFFFSNKVKVPANQLTASIAGIIAGLMNGFFSIPGPPVVLYYSSAIGDKRQYIATVQFLFLTSSILKIGFFSTQYGVNAELINLLPFSILAAVLGTVLGHWAFKKLSSAHIKKLVYIVMVIAGIKYLLF